MMPGRKMKGIITEDAFATLSEKLSTPLQIEFYLTREGYNVKVLAESCFPLKEE